MLDDPQNMTILRIGRHKITWGWFRMDEGFAHLQFGSMLYGGAGVWEYELDLGVIAVYIRWERPFNDR